MERLGKNIRAYRKRLGIKQKELAELMGASQSKLSRWENGIMTPSIKSMQSIAYFLGVSVSDLFEGV